MTLEHLLNTLIQRGWKPFGYKRMKATVNIYWEIRFEREWHFFIETFRTLTSRESWLWQFVCDREHRFIDKKNYDCASLDKRLKNPYVDYDGVNTEYEWITVLDYQYRLIESALCDEDKLEEFLLDNIKIDEKYTEEEQELIDLDYWTWYTKKFVK